MLIKPAFAILATLIAAGPMAGSNVAQAQVVSSQKCWHDGDPKHFRPECRELKEVVEQVEKKKAIAGPVENVPRNQAAFDPDNLFEQMTRDSGGGAGGGGGGR